jgi:hypothetical protein
MKFTFALCLMAPALLLATPKAQVTHHAAKHPASLTASKRLHSGKIAPKAKATSSTEHTTKSTAKGSGKRRTVAKRKPKGPSYQTHPTPERYQEIQQALADKGYYKGPVNGEWGDDSTDALKRFQTDNKIYSDGKVNSLSLIQLGLGPKHDGSAAPAPGASPSTITTPPTTPPGPLQAPGNPAATESSNISQPAAPGQQTDLR